MHPLLAQHAALRAALHDTIRHIDAADGQLAYDSIGGSIFPLDEHTLDLPVGYTLAPHDPRHGIHRSHLYPLSGEKPAFDTRHAELAAHAAVGDIERAAQHLDHLTAQFTTTLRAELERASPGWTCMAFWAVAKASVRAREVHGLAFSFGRKGISGLSMGLYHIAPDSPHWDTAVRRLDTLTRLETPATPSDTWKVFTKGRGIGQWDASRPHQARNAQDAITRCAALEWPDLFRPWKDNTVWAAVLPLMPATPTR